MILNIKKNTLDYKKIGDVQIKTLSALANNYCISCEELARFIYNDELNIYTKKSIHTTIYRLRKRGIHIKTQYDAGFRLIETIYIDY